MRHGDLWSGNLLVEGGGLSGMLDWDAWHPAGAPGADLFHLAATEVGLRNRRPMGRMAHGRVWRQEEFDWTDSYFRALGLNPDPNQLDAIGTAWWAGQAANSVRRDPDLAVDARWVSDNVEAVLSSL
jgi:aminoglycoside phosphotransferase (APT) family kinase protein